MKNILYSIIFCVISFTTLLAQDSIVAKFVFRSHNNRSGLFISSNSGSNWLSKYDGLPANCSVLTSVVNDTNLFVGTDRCGVFLSTNNGTSWASVNSGLTNTEVYALAVSGTKLFAGTNGGVFLSTDNGTSWNAANTGLTDDYVRALAIRGTNLFAGTAGFIGGGVFLSTNSGTTWTNKSSGLTTHIIQALAISDTNIFAGTPAGVFLSTNDGTSWTKINTGLTKIDVRSLIVSGTNIFAGTFGGLAEIETFSGSVFLSTNNGINWTEVNNGLTTNRVLSLAVSGTNLFAGTAGFDGGVFLSTNNGSSWTETGLRNVNVYALTVSGKNLFAGTDKGVTLPYRLFIPENYSPSKKYPLVLVLHGNGAQGTNNISQMDETATVWANPVNQANYPCFVVVPQCPVNKVWADAPVAGAVINLVDSLIREFTIDTNRLYITGWSMGGFGTWDMITLFPNRFAAAIPMSGGGHPALVSNIVNTPIWDFHGALDNGSTSVELSRHMMAALESIGRTVVYTNCYYDDCSGLPFDTIAMYVNNHADLFYTEYQHGGHGDIVTESYDYPLLFPWVFDKHLITAVPEIAGGKLPENFELKQNYPNPFNPITTIIYSIPKQSLVTLKIYDVLGREVATLANEEEPAGTYNVKFSSKGGSVSGGNVSSLASGVYFYRLKAGNYVSTKKLILLK